MAESIIYVENAVIVSEIFGSFDSNIRLIEDRFGVRIYNKNDSGNSIVISGEEESVALALKTVNYLKKCALSGDGVNEQVTLYAINMCSDGKEEELAQMDDSCICITAKGKPIKAKTVGQKKYVDLIKNNTVVFGVGPAGTGKTFLAVAMAVSALRKKEVSRIILTRPAVEAGERLGYLPGDLQSKIDPYLRPLYDALYETMGAEAYSRNVEKGVIEIAPLAYMRGRTLDDSFIILDEAQNTTPEQMKMFLTRMGFSSKAIITGDLTQTDLPRGQKSGLAQAITILDGIDDIKIHRFTDRDVVRHKLVQRIILAYEKFDRDRSAKDEKKSKTFKKAP